MSVNNIGPNIGGSSLLASYLEKQNTAPAVQTSQIQAPAQNAISSPQTPLRTFSEQSALPKNSAVVQFQAPQTDVMQASQTPTVQIENNTEKSANKAVNKAEKKNGNEAKKPSFITRAKEFFKNPKSKKIIIGGIVAAVAIAGITAFALLSRRKPQSSPELESALWDFVNMTGDFFGRGK